MHAFVTWCWFDHGLVDRVRQWIIIKTQWDSMNDKDTISVTSEDSI